jgi:creatinine amidohydrolase
MRPMILALALAAGASAPHQSTPSPQPAPRSYRLQDLNWLEAEQVLTPDTVVLIPLGAGSIEHGPHLKLRNDQVLADYLTSRTAASTAVVIAPTLTYHYYPAFTEYPGSATTSLDTARDLTADVIRSLARDGPRRFYVLNTATTTQPALSAAAETLAADGILLRFTNWESRLNDAARGLREQEGGSHADEIETSMMLQIDPASVDMSRVVKEYGPRSNPFVLSRRTGTRATFSATGIWGDPTRATAEKGRVLIENVVAEIQQDIQALRGAQLPGPAEKTTEPAPAQRPAVTRQTSPGSDCSEGDVRVIRAIGDAFTAYWANGDADRIGGLWTPDGDIVHPDATVERTSAVIAQNRADLFKRRDYRLTKHPMQIGNVKCIAAGMAVADGKWELRGLIDTDGKILPAMRGLCTLIVRRTNLGWQIVAYRYTIDPSGPTVPTLLKRPGFPGRFD